MGEQAAMQAREIFGSKEGINRHISRPLMGNGQMTTVNRETKFSANIQCPSAIHAVGIMFLPAGGNDYRLLVRQDTDLDGSFDYTFDTGSIGTVSGVCTNGIISCNPSGSWNACKMYKWTVSAGKIGLAQVSANDSGIGACFCSNESCGVTSLVPQIYESVGGGILSALMGADTGFLYSKSEWSAADMTYYLFGQDRRNCSGIGSSGWDGYGEKNPTGYYNAQVPPDVTISDIEAKQGGDGNSYYSMMHDLARNDYNGTTIGTPEIMECTVRKDALIETVTENLICADMEPQGSWQSYTWDGRYWCRWAKSGENYLSFDNIRLSIRKGQSIALIKNWDASNCDDDTATISYSVSGDISSASTDVCPGGRGAAITYRPLTDADGPMSVTIDYFRARHSGGGWDGYSMAVLVSQQFKKDRVTFRQSDTCGDTAGCTLVDEWICDRNGDNCIRTVTDGTRGSITPSGRCYSYSSETDNYTVCDTNGEISVTSALHGTSILYRGEDAYFHIRRRYECGTAQMDIDVSKATATAQSAKKEETSPTSVSYTDFNGSTAVVEGVPRGDDCPAPVCTVRKAAADTARFSDGTNRSQTAGGSGVIETLVRQCTKSGGGPAVCPLGDGETMIEDCSCTGSTIGMQKAITTLSVVSESAKDMICSQE